MKIIKTSILLLTFILFGSCDEYCDFEFSEEYFPLAVGNTWEYSDLNTRASYNKWEIIDSINESGIKKYVIAVSDGDGEIWGTYLIYYDDKKLYTNMYFPVYWNYNEEIISEYVIVDFSKQKGSKFSTIGGEGIIASKEKYIVKVGYIPERYEEDYWGFEIIFEKGKGITEIYDPLTWHSDKIQLIDYEVN